MYSKGQLTRISRYNSNSHRTHKESFIRILLALASSLVGFSCGILLMSWRNVVVVPHCSFHTRCCTNTHIGQVMTGLHQSRYSKTINESTEGKDNFIFVGIMTAKKYIDNRGLSSHKTWARTITGEVMFFSSEGSSSSKGVPVVALPAVDDTYPPQKKSFMMLKYMYDHYLDKYEWFVRADDDLFIKGDKLEEFLRSINSSKPLFIGQGGVGKPNELGTLSLKSDENFCMGGPGMIFSRETLRRVAPHINYCLRNLYTSHEDIEISRCVRKFAKIQCTWSYEMHEILYQNYKESDGSFKKTLKSREVQEAITLHPVKDPDFQYTIYHYLQSVRMRKEHHKEVLLHRDFSYMTDLIQDDRLPLEQDLWQPPSLVKFVPMNSKEAIPWVFVTRYLYSYLHSNPRRGNSVLMKDTLDELVNQFLIKLNHNAYLRGRTIHFKDILYAYHRLDPINGPDYIVDLLLVYKKFGDKKMSLNVRRHAYLQQVFLPAVIKEDLDITEQDDTGVGAKLKSLIHMFAANLALTRSRDKKAEHVDIIMPLLGRFSMFQRFMVNLEKVVLKPGANARLVLVLYRSEDEPEFEQLSLDLVQQYQQSYGHKYIEVIQARSEFTRGSALDLGVKYCSSEGLLFFVDVDIVFSSSSLERVHLNTRKGSQAYFPLVFSQYDPEPLCVSDSIHCECKGSDCYIMRDDLSEAVGYWRVFGFGIAGMYRSDYHKVGGFDLGIRGWGKEDVDLYTKFIENNYLVFRAADPGMVHVFHRVACSETLNTTQLDMCINSRAQSYGATSVLASQCYDNPDIVEDLELNSTDDGLKNQSI